MAFPILYTGWTSFTGWSLSAGTPPDFIGARNYTSLVCRHRLHIGRTCGCTPALT